MQISHGFAREISNDIENINLIYIKIRKNQMHKIQFEAFASPCKKLQ